MTEHKKYQEHIQYTHNAFCKIVIRHAAIDAARSIRSRRSKEISLDFLIGEKHYPYRLKNHFLLVMRASPDDAPQLLADWLLLAENYDFKEFKACITAFHNWSAEILNSIRFPWSNGFTEGCNNKSKVLKRVSFGVRNFERFRNRILHCSA